MEKARFTQNDLAKYPFLKETAAFMKRLNLEIEELTNPEMELILNRAEERVENAILSVSVGEKRNNYIEIPSFPVAIMLVTATNNSFIKKRYALAEAKQVFSNLQSETRDRILAIALDFDWDIKANRNSKMPFEFKLNFTDYLRNIVHLRDTKWKLVNRILVSGQIYLSQKDVGRLLQEEVQRRIEKRLEDTELPSFPRKIMEVAERLLKLAKERIGQDEMEGFPKTVTQSAFPPCIAALQEAMAKGHHLSHVGRFTLTSFLVSIGMPSEKVAELFKSFSDYNAKLTRYQIEHIAGERGSRTRYTPPNCATLQTHGVCVKSNDIACHGARNPLIYYKRKLKP